MRAAVLVFIALLVIYNLGIIGLFYILESI